MLAQSIVDAITREIERQLAEVFSVPIHFGGIMDSYSLNQIRELQKAVIVIEERLRDIEVAIDARYQDKTYEEEAMTDSYEDAAQDLARENIRLTECCQTYEMQLRKIKEVLQSGGTLEEKRVQTD